jgi:superfamily I DNA/RNA helicase
VFLPYLESGVQRAAETEEESSLTDQRRKLFTAMTRAREQLVMTYQGELPEPLSVLREFVQ